MLRCRLSPALVVVVFLIGSYASAGAAPRALLELFTSQGCSSCPAADKLLGEFADDPSIVALSLPIDIWDYLGWKDTLASPAHTARQRAYARARGDLQVYTPQIVVDGTMHVLGSDRAAIERAIAQSGQKPNVMSVPVQTLVSGSDLSVKLASSDDGKLSSEVWLCPLTRAVSVAIGRGENRGRTLTYHNVVRHWLKLGEFSGTAESWTVPLSAIASDDIDGAAVMVQEGTRDKPGIILGAALTVFQQAQRTTENSDAR